MQQRCIRLFFVSHWGSCMTVAIIICVVVLLGLGFYWLDRSKER